MPTVADRQIRYERKLQTAREKFRDRFGRWPETQRVEAIATLSSIPDLFGYSIETTCPACGKSAPVRGMECSRKDGPSLRAWFDPRNFSCPVCGLILEVDELEFAGIYGFFLDDYVEGSALGPLDADDLTRLPEWDP